LQIVDWLPQSAIYNLQSAIRQEDIVSHYTIDELIARWKKEELTVEQVIGQMLLMLKEQERRLKEALRPAPAPGDNRPER